MSAPRFDVMAVRLALSGEVGAWIDAYAVPRETAVYELQRLAAELQRVLNDNREWRLRRLEAVLDAPDMALEDLGADCP